MVCRSPKTKYYTSPKEIRCSMLTVLEELRLRALYMTDILVDEHAILYGLMSPQNKNVEREIRVWGL